MLSEQQPLLQANKENEAQPLRRVLEQDKDVWNVSKKGYQWILLEVRLRKVF